MIDTSNLNGFLDRLLDKDCAFAIWSMPGDETIEILISGGQDVIQTTQFNKLNGQEGFAFAPYHLNGKNPLILLKPGVYKKGLEEILAINLDRFKNNGLQKQEVSDHFIIEKEEYLKDINQTIKEIKGSKLSKAIISRLIPVDRKTESIGKLYIQLFKQTPNAFVYLLNVPGLGLWMGATPEILLKSEGKTMETVSLAGTQTRKDGTEYSWLTKDIEEQAFVSRYLLDVLYRFNIQRYSTYGPVSLESGKVAHLMTSFRFAAKNLADNLGDFVAELHPTPAVCGYPKSKADKFISAVEKHDRRYYSGYLGPWRLNDSVGLFVNLRCMEILPDRYILYAGGGITSRSIPEEEWEETNKKAGTLLSAIEAVQNT